MLLAFCNQLLRKSILVIKAAQDRNPPKRIEFAAAPFGALGPVILPGTKTGPGDADEYLAQKDVASPATRQMFTIAENQLILTWC